MDYEELNLTEFIDIIGYEGLYKINKLGQVWSYKYKKIMSFSEEQGYLRIGFTKDRIKKSHRLHRLLGIQFIPNPNNLPEIDHIDRNTLNNDLENLRWCDRITNANNKTTNISLLTEEEQNERIEKIKEQKRVWAENKRRENGILPKPEPKSIEEINEKNKINMREKRANMTEEEKEEYNKARRENRKEETEEQKEQARERARKQREKIKSNEDEVERNRAYKREKAREYRKQGKDTYYEDHKEKILKKKREEYDTKKEEINAKRREAYRLKKLEKENQ